MHDCLWFLRCDLRLNLDSHCSHLYFIGWECSSLWSFKVLSFLYWLPHSSHLNGSKLLWIYFMWLLNVCWFRKVLPHSGQSTFLCSSNFANSNESLPWVKLWDLRCVLRKKDFSQNSHLKDFFPVCSFKWAWRPFLFLYILPQAGHFCWISIAWRCIVNKWVCSRTRLGNFLSHFVQG